jgi:DNA replication protein DnaC
MAKVMHEVRKFKDDNMIKKMAEEEYLLLDDLGAEYASDFTLENLFFLVDARYLRRLVNIFTSNLTIEELYRTYGDRIMGRLLENSTKVVLTGPDRRKEKAG